jgi:hypothetical protein
MGGINPSFYGFGDSSKTGIMYSTEGFNQNTKMENKFAFAHHYFEDNSFSMAMDINFFDNLEEKSKKTMLKKFISSNKENSHLSEELKTARSILKK